MIKRTGVWLQPAIFMVAMALVAILPFLALTKLGGIESSQFTQALGLYGYFFPLAVMGYIGLYILRVSKAPFGYAFFHEPSEGWLFRLLPTLKKYFTLWNIFLGSLILAVGLLYIGVKTNNYGAAIPPIQQQFTELGQVIGSAEPFASTENTIDMLLLFTQLSIVLFLIKRYGITKEVFYLGIFIIVITQGVFRVQYHEIAYPNSEASQSGIFLTGAVGTTIITATGTIIPYYIWHDVNNAVLRLAGDATHSAIVSGETLTTTLALLAFAFFALLVFSIMINKSSYKETGGVDDAYST